MFVIIALAVYAGLKAQDANQIDEPVRQKADMFYLDAVNQRLKGNHSEAFELYRHVLSICPNHVGANYDISSYYHGIGDNQMSRTSLENAAKADPANYWANMGLVQLYASTGDNDKALNALENMAEQYPNNSTVLLMLEDLYIKQKNYDKVINVLNRLELHEGISEQISLEKLRIYKQMGKDNEAMEVLRKLDADNPYDVRYKVMMGDFFMDKRQFDKAYDIYKELYEKEPEQLSVLLALGRYYEETRNVEQYNKIIGEIVTNEALDNSIRLSVMQEICTSSLYDNQNNDTTMVMELFDNILAMPQENTDIAELCARYMISSEMPKERIKPVLHQMLDINPQADLARDQLLIYAIEEDNDNEVRKLCTTAVEYSSDNPLYYYYLGVVNLRNHDYQKTIDVCNKGLAKVKKETNLDIMVNMYAVIGDSYHRIGQNNKAYEYYDSCLLYKPNQVTVLNNYAYYLALEKKNLNKAEEMAAKAIEIETDNPTYIDTYAWVLFQQKKYIQAKQQIDKVMSLIIDDYQPAHATLVEHAGDIYYKCSDKNKALELWKIAKQLGTKSTTIDRKISKKRYFEF